MSPEMLRRFVAPVGGSFVLFVVLVAGGLLYASSGGAARDNLVWLARCTETGAVAAVDGPNAKAALEYCEARGWTLSVVLNTHTHGDHIGINRDLDKRGLLAGMRAKLEAMAVVAVMTAIEDRFGVLIDDDEVSADTFESLGSLIQFVQRKLAG